MKTGFKKLFSKKKAKEGNPAPTMGEGYSQMSSTDLNQMSQVDLINLIHKYNSEVSYLNKMVQDITVERDALKGQAKKSKEEVSLYKEQMELMMMNQSASTQGQEQQMKNLMEKVAQLEKQRQDENLENHKRLIEFESMQKELSRLQYQRENMESEIQTLKDYVSNKDKKLHKNHVKIESLQSQLLEKTGQLATQKYEYESKINQLNLEISKNNENHFKDTYSREENLQRRIQQLEKELYDKSQGSSVNEKQVKELTDKLSTMQEKYQTMYDDHHQLQQQYQELQYKQRNTEEKNQQTLKQLKKSEQKRQLARDEVIKLSQKLQSAQNQIKEESSDRSLPQQESLPESLRLEHTLTNYEHKNLVILKAEIDILYKLLMRLMMNAQTQQSEGSKEIFYTISGSDIATLESRLNNTVSQVQEIIEQADEIQEQSQPIGFTNKFTSALNSLRQSVTGRAPVKLFSCMSSNNDNPTIGIMQPRSIQGQRIISNTGGLRHDKGIELNRKRSFDR